MVETALSSVTLGAHLERLIYTGSGSFTGIGNSLNNTITGGTGNDMLIGGGGADHLIGGDGIDIVSYFQSESAVTINLTTNIHTGDAAGDTFESIEVILGSNHDDTFTGNAGANIFHGGGGIDIVNYVSSTAAVNIDLTANVNFGGDADGDSLIAIERVIGSNFGDRLFSATAGHILEGGLGDDVYVLGDVNVQIIESGDEGIDMVETALSSVTLGAHLERLTYTGSGSFTGIGNSLNNTITGGTGNDMLIGGGGADRLIGGDGIDIVSYAGASVAVNINLKTGVHTGDAVGDLFESIEGVVGSDHDDTFIGNAGANHFDGGDGIDIINYVSSSAAVNVNLTTSVNIGGDADGDSLVSFERVIGSGFGDRLSSATAGHVLAGGLGNDVYVLGDVNVQIIESGDEGIDMVETALSSVTLGAHLERLIYTGMGNFTGIGNDLDNVLVGGMGNDTLIGLGGADYFVGGGGADHFIGGDGVDILSYAGASVAVNINLMTGVHTGEAAGDTFEGIEIILGSDHDDTFIGNAGANIFHGDDGIDIVNYAGASAAVSIDLTAGVYGGDAENDWLISIEHVIGSGFGDRLSSSTEGDILEGGFGDDIYVVDRTGVRVIEVGGAGIDRVETSLNTFTLCAGVENLTYTGRGAFIGTGNDLDNTITGGIGNDMLIGGGGADRLIGGGGIDMVSYASASAAVSINLTAGIHTGDAAGDTFESIEMILGSDHDDIFFSNTEANVFIGGGGIDTVSYAESNIGIMVNLTTGVHGGGAEGDTFRDVEVIRGSSANDFFIGDAEANTFHGGAGTDTVVFRGKRSDYAITFDGMTQTYTLSDRRSGSPDGSDKVTGLELFQFADQTLAVEALMSQQNFAPTDIVVKGGTIAENSRAGTVVATLAGFDPDADDTASFSLVAGATDRFELAGNAIRVKTGAVLDYETQSSHELGVMVTDTAGATFTKEITITVSDVVNEGVREGTAKKDVIYGKAGDAVIYGYAGNDVLVAGVNGSTLWGGSGNDMITGNCADDRIIGEQGDDMLAGLEGMDTFVFGANEGNDVIYDFNVAEDLIEIHGIALATSFQQIMANISEADGQIMIDFGDDNGVSLDGVSKWQLTPDNFIFA
jgi:Ca2+-binding RTX toxin-like protein